MVSDQEPFACRRNVITTTLQKQVIAWHRQLAERQCSTPLCCCRFWWLDLEPMSLYPITHPLLSTWFLNLSCTSKFKSIRPANVERGNDFSSFIKALSSSFASSQTIVLSICFVIQYLISIHYSTHVLIINGISLKLNITELQTFL